MLDRAREFLRSIQGLEPGRAREALGELRERYPEAVFRLLWQREEYDGSLHYDLLIKESEHGTVSLSWCPDRALPWPLRGVHRASELLLLRVNGVDMQIPDAIAQLDFLWDEARLTDRLVTACLLQEELYESPIAFSEAELQEAVDAFRRARGLVTAQVTREWMELHSLSVRDLEELVAGEAAVARLRDRVTAGQVESYFAEHRGEFDRVRVARLVYSDQTHARRAAEQVLDGADFYAVAEREFLTGRASGDLFGDLPADELGQGEKGVVEAGDVLGPIPLGDEFAVLKVLSVETAALDDRTRQRVGRVLFDEWIAERRKSAKIEWFWGNTARTDSL
ncbi:putative peptide maturation system protein [Streptosporangium subroseum]|uniref:Putative peptide maturation system protein n=2 Tax=Streptosporangium subroseum TaxID=106412 RepID=A0A239P4W0_9ACTN|nr:putative peptide maturation system protein [Streptosporangium subroseum]